MPNRASRIVRRMKDAARPDVRWFADVLAGVETEWEYTLDHGETWSSASPSGALHQLHFYGRTMRTRQVTPWKVTRQCDLPAPTQEGGAYGSAHIRHARTSGKASCGNPSGRQLMNNPLDLEAIKARADALSDFDGEPWQVWYHTTTRVPLSVGPDNHNECFELDGMSEADAEFVAHAWADVPALVAEVERLREKAALVDEMRDLAQRHILSSVFADVLFDVTDDQPRGSQTEGAGGGT